MTAAEELPIEIDVTTVDAMIRAGEDFLLLDVREPDEHAIARIDGSLLLPISRWSDRAEELSQYRNQPIVVHCHHGIRSMRVTETLRNAGFAKVQNMAGGIDAWSQKIDPQTPRY